MANRNLTVGELQLDIDSIDKYIAVLEPLADKLLTDDSAAAAFEEFIKNNSAEGKLPRYEIQGAVNMLKKVKHMLETVIGSTPVNFRW